MDGIIIVGDDSAGISKVKEKLTSHFHTMDIGPLRYFFGIEISRSSEQL